MLAIIITAFITLLYTLARDGTCSAYTRDSVKNDDDSGMLRELLQRMDKMQSHMDKMQTHIDRIERSVDQIKTNMNEQFDQMERNNNKRFDQLETHIEVDKKNLTVVVETIVEQQMVITAEIFTVSQTLPFCCCQYRNTTDPAQVETTTIDPGKPETTTPTTLTSLPTNCAEAMGESGSDGIYQINVTNSNIGPFDVYCVKNVDCEREKDICGTWLIIQRAQDGATDFHKNWKMYQSGFGELTELSFWIGLDKLYALTKSTEQELWVRLENSERLMGWAKYSNFSIGSESEKYALKTLGRYVGTAGDSLSQHRSRKFSTFDQDNDDFPALNIAEFYKTGWWLKINNNCILNAYRAVGNINWNTYSGKLKYSQMAIRPRK